MNTSLGIEFLRTVNEEGSRGWAQVYARVPFDDYELLEKGALFGVFGGKTADNWTEIEGELMEWVDEYFNKTEKAGEMTFFSAELREKYPDIDGVWMWVVPSSSGKRDLKMIKWGDAGVLLEREGREYNLTEEENRVIVGTAVEGDILRMWSGVLGSMFTEEEKSEKINEEVVMKYGNRMTEAREAGAGLFFVFGKYLPEKTKIVEEVQVPEKLEVVDEVKEEQEVKEELEKVDEDLAGDSIVGKVGVKEKIVGWWRKKGAMRGSEIRVDREGVDKRKKWAVFLGIVFLLILCVSLVTGSIKIKADREAKKWNDFSEPITKSIQEAKDLASINPSGAKKIMEDVKSTFAVQKAEFVNGKYKNEVVRLEEEINGAWVIASGEKQSQITELVNIQLVREGFVGERMSLIKDNTLLVTDSKMGIVASVTTTSKDIKVVAGKGEGLAWIDAMSDGSRVMVMNAKGVSVDGKESGGIVFDSAVNNPVTLGKFGSNVYILDAGNKEIFKYGAISDGYGDRTRWLKQNQSISVMPVDMVLDANVWVLGNDGTVEKFLRGAKEQFILNGVPEGTKATRIAIQQEGDGMAILDTTNGVVVLCGKETGNCSQQLKSEKLKTASDIEYDGSGNLLVLIAGVVASLK
ncbi:MAG TPA: hypothetical protein PLI45_03415 [Candidatus Woesebacteria bacterium]|nr:hypothetical protein [Candidatus Woesebacteria bacterium]